MSAPSPEGRKLAVDGPGLPPDAEPEAIEEGPAEPDVGGAASAVDEGERVLAERDEYLDSLQRLKAEFENYRRRAERDRSAAAIAATRDLVTQFVPVMDNIERAVDALAPYGEEATSGVEMVRDQLGAVLSDAGIDEIVTAPGDAFDPAVHEAVARQPTDARPEGVVTQVVQRGYRDAEGVVRPVQVVVAIPASGGG